MNFKQLEGSTYLITKGYVNHYKIDNKEVYEKNKERKTKSLTY